MNDLKLCDGSTLVYLCERADKYEFNRRANTERLKENLDYNAINVLQRVIPYHKGSGPSRDPVWPDHHRAIVVTQVMDNGEETIVEFTLDIEADKWDEMLDVKDVELLKDVEDVQLVKEGK